MTLRSSSTPDLARPWRALAAPVDPDAPALSPTDRPHALHLRQAARRPVLDALGLLGFQPVDHQDHVRARTFGPPAPDALTSSTVQRLPQMPGRPHPVFSSPRYAHFLADVDRLLDAVRQDGNDGANARYIPQLAHRDAHCLSLSVVAPNGAHHGAGDGTVFSIQSLCKMFILAAALQEHGVQGVSRYHASTSSGQPFDGPSTVGLLGHPLEPAALACTGPVSTTTLLRLMAEAGDRRFANASCNLGAIGATMLLPRRGGAIGRQARLMRLIERLGLPRAQLGHTVSTAHDIHGSEIRDTGGNQLRARAAARLMDGAVPEDGDLPLHAFEEMQAYIAACALEMDTSGLAAAYAAFVTGRNAFTGERVLDAGQAAFVRAQMQVGGLYRHSGAFFDATGMVAKSGVGGGIVAICPATGLSIAVHATRLDAQGNSVRGLALLRRIAALDSLDALRRACRADR